MLATATQWRQAMGLTISYKLTTDLTRTEDVRRLVETMRQHALDIPFKEVGTVKEFVGEDSDYRSDSSEGDRWLKLQSSGFFSAGGSSFAVAPIHVIAFSTWPGEGSEPANFGFCKYPAFIPSDENGGPEIPTDLTGWRWRSFCKTQYASDPKCGGIKNFLRSHLCVVKLLDFLKQTGLIAVEVQDEGGYWDKRDLAASAKEVGQWNVLIAGFVSGFRSATEGKIIEAPITSFPNFEHLEAKGLERLAELLERLRQDSGQ
jgi:hypothetical protein